jgi:hypothetical protein
MRRITQAYGESFQDEELDLSGATILNCVFQRCKITFNEPATSYQPQFVECAFNVPSTEVWKWLRAAIPSSELGMRAMYGL